MAGDRCECRLLAQGLAGYVEYCSHCGVFHVHVDSVTVRFRPTALRDLRDTLTVAISNYEYLRRTDESDAPDSQRVRQDAH